MRDACKEALKKGIAAFFAKTSSTILVQKEFAGVEGTYDKTFMWDELYTL